MPQLKLGIAHMDEREVKGSFMQYFLKAQPSLRSYLRAILIHDADVEDVFQEVSLALWERFSEYDSSRPFLYWAIGVARNQAARWRRDRSRVTSLTPELEEQLAATYGELEAALAERRRVLRMCVEKLGALARELVRMRYERNLPLQEIAELRQMSLNAVNKALGKIRISLSKCTKLTAFEHGSAER